MHLQAQWHPIIPRTGTLDPEHADHDTNVPWPIYSATRQHKASASTLSPQHPTTLHTHHADFEVNTLIIVRQG